MGTEQLAGSREQSTTGSRPEKAEQNAETAVFALKRGSNLDFFFAFNLDFFLFPSKKSFLSDNGRPN